MDAITVISIYSSAKTAYISTAAAGWLAGAGLIVLGLFGRTIFRSNDKAKLSISCGIFVALAAMYAGRSLYTRDLGEVAYKTIMADSEAVNKLRSIGADKISAETLDRSGVYSLLLKKERERAISLTKKTPSM